VTFEKNRHQEIQQLTGNQTHLKTPQLAQQDISDTNVLFFTGKVGLSSQNLYANLRQL
jgi:hypothetical protein